MELAEVIDLFRALLVDDEELALVSLRYSFPWEEYGFTEVTAVSDPRKALALLKERRIDAAFVDIRMPGLSGLELLAQARQAGVGTSFIIVSGYSDFSYAKEAIHYDVLDYCLKPVPPEDAPGILDKLSLRILADRIAGDPALVSRLLSDREACGQLLLHMAPAEPESCAPMTLLDIQSPSLLPLLREAEALAPGETLFLSRENALLLWPMPCPEDRFHAFLERSGREALLIYGSAQPQAAAFQNALKRVLTEHDNRDAKDTGIVCLPPVSAGMADSLNHILAYVEARFRQDLSLQDLAREFSINYTYLSRQFKKSVGKSFSEYLTEVRLREAGRLLRDTRMRVTAIAEQVGYNDYHYFNNVFKRQFSMTPLQYRNASPQTAGPGNQLHPQPCTALSGQPGDRDEDRTP